MIFLHKDGLPFYSLHMSTFEESKHTQNNVILLPRMVSVVVFNPICTFLFI